MSFYFSRRSRSFPIIIWTFPGYSLPSSQPAGQETESTIISLLDIIVSPTSHLSPPSTKYDEKSWWWTLCLCVCNAVWTASSISLYKPRPELARPTWPDLLLSWRGERGGEGREVGWGGGARLLSLPVVHVRGNFCPLSQCEEILEALRSILPEFFGTKI